jgi:putative cyclase
MMARLGNRLILCFSVIVVAVWLPSSPIARAQRSAGTPALGQNLGIEVFDRMMTELSNWGRWGKDDQKGAVNLITPAKRKQALAVVKDGVSVSMARTAEMEPAIDNPAPVVLGRPARGGRAGDAGREGAGPPAALPNAVPNPISGANDTLFMQYHGFVHTHMDTFCHRAYKGLMYNGMPMTEVTEAGCNKGSILNFKDGIVTRGVLMDIPRLKGVEYLEPGTRIMPEDLELWAKQAHFQVLAGDLVLIRTGRWARRDKLGPWPTVQLAGLYITCARWLHQHDLRFSAATPRRTCIRPAWTRSPSRFTRWCSSPWGCRFSTISISRRSAKKRHGETGGNFSSPRLRRPFQKPPAHR